MKTFHPFNLSGKTLTILKENGFIKPTTIQEQAIPHILKNKSIIAISNTGSGKTLAFAVPILNVLIKTNQFYHTLIIVPTRELAKQIESVFSTLGESIGLRVLSIIGGENEKEQKNAIFKSPHIIIGTPGRLKFIFKKIHLFKKLKYLVLDESDKLLEKNYEDDLFNIIEGLNDTRTTLLFSATMTDSVEKLATLSLKDPVKIEINKSLDTVDNLSQKYIFIPLRYKECYLYSILKDNTEKKIVFINSCLGVQTYSLFLRNMGLSCLSLYGDLSQEKRLETLEEFKKTESCILIATDVASRGLDIPLVETVINYELPKNSRDYVHRVGRTARAGLKGTAISFVTQYDIETFQKLECSINKKMDEFVIDKESAIIYNEKVGIVHRNAYNEIKEEDEGKIPKRRRNK